MLMDAPPPQKTFGPLFKSRALLELGLSAPRIMARDVEAGFLYWRISAMTPTRGF